jgi:hypothetical protein
MRSLGLSHFKKESADTELTEEGKWRRHFGANPVKAAALRRK